MSGIIVILSLVVLVVIFILGMVLGAHIDRNELELQTPLDNSDTYFAITTTGRKVKIGNSYGITRSWVEHYLKDHMKEEVVIYKREHSMKIELPVTVSKT